MLVSYEALMEITNMTTELLGEKFVLLPVSSPQSTHWLALDWTGTPVVRGHELTEVVRFSTKKKMFRSSKGSDHLRSPLS